MATDLMSRVHHTWDSLHKQLKSPLQTTDLESSQKQIAHATMTKSAELLEDCRAALSSGLRAPAEQEEIRRAYSGAEIMHQAGVFALWCLENKPWGNEDDELLDSALKRSTREFELRQKAARDFLKDRQKERQSTSRAWKICVETENLFGGKKIWTLFEQISTREGGFAVRSASASDHQEAPSIYDLLLGETSKSTAVGSRKELYHVTAMGFYFACDSMFLKLCEGGQDFCIALNKVELLALDFAMCSNLDASRQNILFANWLLDCSLRFYQSPNNDTAACHTLQDAALQRLKISSKSFGLQSELKTSIVRILLLCQNIQGAYSFLSTIVGMSSTQSTSSDDCALWGIVQLECDKVEEAFRGAPGSDSLVHHLCFSHLFEKGQYWRMLEMALGHQDDPLLHFLVGVVGNTSEEGKNRDLAADLMVAFFLMTARVLDALWVHYHPLAQPRNGNSEMREELLKNAILDSLQDRARDTLSQGMGGLPGVVSAAAEMNYRLLRPFDNAAFAPRQFGAKEDSAQTTNSDETEGPSSAAYARPRQSASTMRASTAKVATPLAQPRQPTESPGQLFADIPKRTTRATVKTRTTSRRKTRSQAAGGGAASTVRVASDKQSKMKAPDLFDGIKRITRSQTRNRRP